MQLKRIWKQYPLLAKFGKLISTFALAFMLLLLGVFLWLSTGLASETAVALERLGVPVSIDINAIKTDLLLVDNNGNGQVNPGDTLRYTVIISNDGTTDATNLVFSDTLDANTTLSGTVHVSPLAIDDQYTAVGNTMLEVASSPSASPAVVSTTLITDNDLEFLGDTFSVSQMDATSAQGGSVTNTGGGGFQYMPPIGFTGIDSFNYTLQDGFGLTGRGVVSITVSSMVWYVDSTPPGPGPATGQSNNPFATIAQLNAAATNVGDFIYFFAGTSPGYDSDLPLLNNQQVIGEGVDLIVNGITLRPAGSRPVLSGSSGHGITLAQNNQIRGVDINNTAGTAIRGINVGNAIVRNVSVTGTGEILNIDGGSPDMHFDGLTTSSADAVAINLQNLGATTQITSTTGITLTGLTANGVVVGNSSGGATFDFGDATVTHSGGTGDGITLNNNSGATVTFNSLNITTANGDGFVANNGGTVDINGTTNTINAVGGPGMDVINTQSNGNWVFSSVSANNNGNNTPGINLDSLTHDVTSNGGALVNTSASTAFRVNAGSSNVTYAGTINETGGEMVDIANRTGGSVTVSGNLACSSSCTGVNVANNSGGSSTFSGGMKAINSGTNTAVNLTTNTGHTINFTSGGLDIDTTSVTGFNAMGGGTINVTGANNDLTTTTGRAIEIVNTTIGTSGVTFRSISAGTGSNGPDRAIVLNNAGSGGFTVTGTGNTAASGGTIQDISNRGVEIIATNNISLTNMTFIDAPTGADGTTNCNNTSNTACRAAIHMDSGTTDVHLDNLSISAADQQAINGNDVTNFTLLNSTLTNCGDEAQEENCIYFRNVGGTVTINNSDISFARRRPVYIHNTNRNINLTLDNTTIRDNQLIFGTSTENTNGEDGLLLDINGGSTNSVNITNSNFLRIRTQAPQIVVRNSSSLNSTITNSTFDVGVGPFNIGRGPELLAEGTAQLTFDISNNPTVNSNGGRAILVSTAGTATMSGHIRNNTITGNNNAGGAILVRTEDDSTGVVNVAGNNASNTSEIFIVRASTRNGSGDLDITIDNNTIVNSNVSIQAGISIETLNSNTMCANIINNNVTLGSGSIQGTLNFDEAGGALVIENYSGSLDNTWNSNGNTVPNNTFVTTGAPSASPGPCQTP